MCLLRAPRGCGAIFKFHPPLALRLLGQLPPCPSSWSCSAPQLITCPEVSLLSFKAAHDPTQNCTTVSLWGCKCSRGGRLRNPLPRASGPCASVPAACCKSGVVFGWAAWQSVQLHAVAWHPWTKVGSLRCRLVLLVLGAVYRM